MSGYTHFAVLGAGNQGKEIVDALLAHKRLSAPHTIVTVLTRPESEKSAKNLEFASGGARVVPFTASSPDAPAALAGIDVVICTLSPFANDVQFDAIRACAHGGVKLFIPCDWGARIWDRDEPFNKRQQAVHAAADQAGLATASFFCGFWPEYLPHFGWDLAAGRISIWGDGKTAGTFTSKPDVARFVVHALTTFPEAKLQKGQFLIEGDRISMLELAEELKKISKRPIEVTTTGQQPLLDRIAKSEWDVTAQISIAFDNGVSGHHGALANDLWPEWKPQRAIDVLRGLLPESA